MKSQRLQTTVESLVDNQSSYYSSLTLDQLVSYMRCGEYFRNELLDRVPEFSYEYTPEQILLQRLLLYLIRIIDTKVNNEQLEKLIYNKVNSLYVQMIQSGLSFSGGFQRQQIMYSVFKFRDFLLTLDSVEEVLAFRTYIASGISVNYMIPLVTKKSIYLFSLAGESSFLRSPYFQIPLLGHLDKEVFIVYIDSNSYKIKQFLLHDVVSFNKLDSLYTSVLYSYRYKIFLPILNCKNTKCPVFSVCTGMATEDQIIEHLQRGNNE